MKKIIIFGTGKIASVFYDYIKSSSELKVEAFCCDQEFVISDHYLNLPWLPFETIEKKFSIHEYKMLIAVGYQQLNSFRTKKFLEAKQKGFSFVQYIHPSVFVPESVEIGENVMILDHVSLQPGVKIGDNTMLWSGAKISHHSNIHENCWFASGASTGGSVVVHKNCFLGVNATTGHALEIGAHSILGAGTLVTKSTPEKSVFIEKDSERFRLDSENFLKLTQNF